MSKTGALPVQQPENHSVAGKTQRSPVGGHQRILDIPGGNIAKQKNFTKMHLIAALLWPHGARLAATTSRYGANGIFSVKNKTRGYNAKTLQT